METIEEENHHMCLLAYPFLLLCLVQQCLLPINAHCPTLFSAVLPVAHTLFGPVMPEKAQTKTMFSVHTSCSFPKHTHTHTPACYCGSTQEFARAPVELPRRHSFLRAKSAFFVGLRVTLKSLECLLRPKSAFSRAKSSFFRVKSAF